MAHPIRKGTEVNCTAVLRPRSSVRKPARMAPPGVEITPKLAAKHSLYHVINNISQCIGLVTSNRGQQIQNKFRIYEIKNKYNSLCLHFLLFYTEHELLFLNPKN